MAKKLGNDYRLFVRAADGAAFNQPAGQGNLTRDGGKNFSSNATKDQEGVDTQQPGLRTISLKQDMIPDLPDANGYTRMETLDKANASEVFQIRKKPFAAADVIFECEMYVTLDNQSYNQGESVKVGVSLVPASQPTVDALA